MGKRRTRKEKIKALHQFKMVCNPEPKKDTFEANVKGQKENTPKSDFKAQAKTENAEHSAKESLMTSTKRDIFRSLLIVSLILGLEVVVYLVWR